MEVLYLLSSCQQAAQIIYCLEIAEDRRAIVIVVTDRKLHFTPSRQSTALRLTYIKLCRYSWAQLPSL
jgi:hypothetical protein